MHRSVTTSRTTAAVLAPLALVLWLFSPVVATAQEPQEPADPGIAQQPLTPAPIGIVEEGAWTLTPHLGFGFGGNLENSPLNVGLAGAYNWTPRVGFEGELGYLRAGRQGVPTQFDTSVFTGNFNVLYHFAVENIAPYGTVGLGFGRANVDFTPIGFAEDTSTELMLNFGGGVKANLTDNVNFRAGIRYFNGSDLVPDFWRPYVGLSFVMGRTVQ